MKTLKFSPKFLTHRILVILAVFALTAAFSAPAFALTCSDNSGAQCGGPSGNTDASTGTTSSSGVCKDTTNAAGKVSPAAINKCLNQSQIVVDLQNVVNF